MNEMDGTHVTYDSALKSKCGCVYNGKAGKNVRCVRADGICVRQSRAQ